MPMNRQKATAEIPCGGTAAGKACVNVCEAQNTSTVQSSPSSVTITMEMVDHMLSKYEQESNTPSA